MTWWMQTQTKRKGFNAAEARVADTGADQFYDAMRGAPKGEAGVIGSTRSTRKPASSELVTLIAPLGTHFAPHPNCLVCMTGASPSIPTPSQAAAPVGMMKQTQHS
ncbi:TPA: hypothetical protein ACH3X3_012865 [Trebouxia sp. C0006]